MTIVTTPPAGDKENLQSAPFEEGAATAGFKTELHRFRYYSGEGTDLDLHRAHLRRPIRFSGTFGNFNQMLGQTKFMHVK
jgi:hypothetical protein